MNKPLEQDSDSFELVQKRRVKRFKLSNTLLWILDGFSLDHGALHTLKNLFFKPGEMVRSYLYQGRLKFTPPFRLLLITTTLVLFAFQYSNINQYTLDSMSNAKGPELNQEFMQYYMSVTQDYTNIFLWLLIPILALFSWLFNRNSAYNYAENLVLNTYYTVFANISFLIFLSDRWLDDSFLYLVYVSANIIHYILCLKGMFQLSWLKSTWQALIILLLSVFIYSISLALLIVALMLSK